MARVSARETSVAHVDGHAINIVTEDDAVACVRARLRAGRGFSFATLNLDHLVKLRDDSAFRAVYARMNFVSADGAPVAALARNETPAIERVTGADLLIPLCRMAARDKMPIALIGSTPESLDAAATRLRDLAPGLIVAYSHSPAFGFDPHSDEADACGEAIAASGAQLCFVCFGAPKQEIFADRMVRRHGAIGFIGVGAAIDFQSGAQVRAPRLLQAFGMEWAWRLATQPRRLAGRYWQCAALLMGLRIGGGLKPFLASESASPGQWGARAGGLLSTSGGPWMAERRAARKAP